MRILHYCENPGGFMYDWHLYHMVDELRHEGHEITYFNPIKFLSRRGSASEYSEVLIDYLKSASNKYDLFFSTATDSTITPGAVAKIKNMDIPTVNLSTDDLFIPFRVKNISREFDLTWTTVRENAHILKSYGANVIVQPWGANPFIYQPVETNEKHSICFIGNPYGARSVYLRRLVEAGIEVKLYSKKVTFEEATAKNGSMLNRTIVNLLPGMKTTLELLKFSSGRISTYAATKRLLNETLRKIDYNYLAKIEFTEGPSFMDFSKAICSNALSLGSIELASTYVLKNPLLFIRLREFEVPMSGGIHIVNQCPELMEYFEPDKEMVFYESPEELIDKTKFYLSEKRDDLRRKIRVNARLKSLNEHTWKHRFKNIFDYLNI